MDQQKRLIRGNISFERAYMLLKKFFAFFFFFFLNEVRTFVFFLFITQTGENESVWVS